MIMTTGKAKIRMGAEERRAQLIESALPVFARKGYAAAGTRDLARAAGVTEPILYRHFDGKAGLFRAVLDEVQARVVGAIDARARGVRGAEARLKALATSLPETLDVFRNELRVLNAAALAHEEPEIMKAAGRCAQGIGHAIAGLFKGSGVRRGVGAQTAGFLLLEVGMGAALLRPMDLPEMEESVFLDRAIDALLHGIVR